MYKNETSIRRALTKILTASGWAVHNVEDKASAGMPDMFAAHKQSPCGSLFLEVKYWAADERAPRKLRPSQVRWLRKFVPVGVAAAAITFDPHRRVWSWSYLSGNTVTATWWPERFASADSLSDSLLRY